jgi:uncharacterized protein YyaL (SSP411 family)
VPRHNLPSFRDVLAGIARTWQEQQGEATRVGNEVTQHLQQALSAGALTDSSFTPAHLDVAVNSLLDSYDWGNGGWGAAPKFPQPMTIEFLLRRSVRNGAGGEVEASMRKASLHALNAMARGGMYDVVGGGFSRYSVDTFWRVPHFEKMLYDNAQLARAYLHAWQITGNQFYKQVLTETVDFIAREMTHPEGGFYSSLDADSEGEEGKFYVWTLEEIRSVLVTDSEFFEAAYGVTARGNFEEHTVLQRALDDTSLAARFKLDPESVSVKLAACHSRLLSVRSSRVRPGTDDKVLTSWNGLMLATLAEAVRVLDDIDYRSKFTNLATRSAEFLLKHLRPEGKLKHSWRNGKTTDEVFLEDYAALILGLLELYQTDFNNTWFTSAKELTDEMIELFADPTGGFFDTSKDGESLLLRPKDLQDNATPSGNALACEALLKLAEFTGEGRYRDLAEKSLGLVVNIAVRYPTAFARWLSAADFALGPTKQVAVVYETGREPASELIKAIRSAYRPNIIVARSAYPPPDDAPALLKDRPLKNGNPTVYVCEGFVCKNPVTLIAELNGLF